MIPANIVRPYSVRAPYGSGFSGPSFERLMEVDIRHGFYNSSDGACPDFEVVPTAATASLMRSLGLLFKAGGTSFSILADRYRQAALVRYLRTPTQEACRGTRLAFLLSLRNPCFVTFTDMPVNHSPARRCYYYSNVPAEPDAAGETVLNPNFPSDAPFRVTGSQYEARVRSELARCVTLQDSVGDVLLCQDVAGSQRPQSVFLGLTSLPEGSYTAGQRDARCGDPDGGPITRLRRVLYAVARRPPFCMIDLFFSGPGGGVYPVSADGEVTPVQYLLRFQPRKTIWNYYVVSTGAPLQDLRIVQEPGRGTAATPDTVHFSGPADVVLPTRQPAARFVSTSSIPLLEQSTYNFQLRGKVGFQEVRNGVLLGRLPAASNRQVIPGAGHFATGDRGRSSPVPEPPMPPQNFSDIYVYV